MLTSRTSHWRCSVKKDVLKNFANFLTKYLYQTWNTRPQPETLLKKRLCHRPETLFKKRLARVFSCEFCKTFKNTFFHRKKAASVPRDSITLCGQKYVTIYEMRMQACDDATIKSSSSQYWKMMTQYWGKSLSHNYLLKFFNNKYSGNVYIQEVAVPRCFLK